MKLTTVLMLAAVIGMTQQITSASAQKTKQKPKNEITKLRKARKTDHTVKQITPDPKKSPGKHTDNLSKNVNHEVNRESKDFNHFINGTKPKKKPVTSTKKKG